MLTTPPGTEPVQESLGGRGVIVITGATGWVGRTAIRELQRLLPAPLFAERVRLFASRPGGLTLEPWPETGEVTLPVYPLSSLVELAAAGPIDAVLHTAFLTRDRLAAVGQELYVATNRWITAQVAESLVLAPAARAVVISSGAAAAYDHHAAASEHLVDDPYGVLKLEEEAILAGVASTLVLRIYALSGRFVRDPLRFALGDFLLSALQGEPIRLRSPIPVLRSYGHAANITALAWHWLMGGEVSSGLPLAAVSLSVDLLTLAQAISSLYGLPLVESAVDHQAPPNSYLADPGPFLAALAHHGITPTPLEEQLRDTAAGLQLP
jgi:nucleoside-diphosphate-sugar epimerase